MAQSAFDLARFFKRSPDGYDRRDACRAGAWLHVWHMTPDHAERVTRREFATEAAAKAAFKAFVGELRKAKYEERGTDQFGWTVDTRGRRGYYKFDALGGGRPWSAGVVVETHALGKAVKTKVKVEPKRAADPKAIAKLVKTKPPAKTATLAQIIEATNTWFAALVAAGFSLDGFPGADRGAIIVSGAYTAAELRASKLKLPASYVELLRSVGDISILGGFAGRETTYPLGKRKGWPMKRTLAEESKVLAWELEQNGAPAKPNWLRFAGNAPGSSDHFFVLDGEKIHRVPDVDLPAEIDETVTGVHAWIHARVRALHEYVRRG